MNKKGELTGNELDIEEVKFNFEENPFKMYYFSFKKKEKKKERIYLLTYNKIKIYSKYNKTKFFKDKYNDKDKDKDKNGKIVGEFKEEEKDNEEKEENEENEENEKDEKDENEEERSTAFSIEEKHKEGYKEQNKIYIYSKCDKKLNIPKFRMKYNLSPNIIYSDGMYIALGGFWNGDIIIRQLIENKNEEKKKKQKKINIIQTGETYPIIKMIMDQTETYVICINNEGTIFIYTIDSNEKTNWNLHKTINEGQGEISDIALNENLNIFIVAFKNGFCMVYTLPSCKLFNSFIIEENDLNNNYISINNEENDENNNITPIQTPINYINNILIPDIIFISQSPLPCYVFYIKSRKSLCVYSINFHFLKEVFLGYEIAPNGIKKYTDYMFKDYLFIFNRISNCIDIHRLFDLTIVISPPAINNEFVDFQFSRDLSCAFILVKTNPKNDDKSTNKILVLKKAIDTGKKVNI